MCVKNVEEKKIKVVYKDSRISYARRKRAREG
jgi:hypothetical protein